MREEILDIVNERDEVISQAKRNEVYEKKLQHRIVHVMLLNEKDEILLQLRSKELKHFPSHWSTSVGGHVQTGESYEQAAIREFEEELGRAGKIELLSKDLFRTSTGINKFLTTYISRDHAGIIAGEDVEKIGFFSKEDIKKMIKAGEKFHPELLFLLEEHFL